jgi:hypothetical protein
VSRHQTPEQRLEAALDKILLNDLKAFFDAYIKHDIAKPGEAFVIDDWKHSKAKAAILAAVASCRLEWERKVKAQTALDVATVIKISLAKRDLPTTPSPKGLRFMTTDELITIAIQPYLQPPTKEAKG